jgi:O-antigen ligase
VVNPHNFFLEILIDYGIIGLSLVVLIFYKCFKINISISRLGVPDYLNCSCKATNVLLCLHIIISVVSSSFLNYWPFCWFPVYLTMMHCGIYDKLNKLEIMKIPTGVLR